MENNTPQTEQKNETSEELKARLKGMTARLPKGMQEVLDKLIDDLEDRVRLQNAAKQELIAETARRLNVAFEMPKITFQGFIKMGQRENGVDSDESTDGLLYLLEDDDISFRVMIEQPQDKVKPNIHEDVFGGADPSNPIGYAMDDEETATLKSVDDTLDEPRTDRYRDSAFDEPNNMMP
jgi:hypothetical protein